MQQPYHLWCHPTVSLRDSRAFSIRYFFTWQIIHDCTSQRGYKYPYSIFYLLSTAIILKPVVWMFTLNQENTSLSLLFSLFWRQQLEEWHDTYLLTLYMNMQDFLFKIENISALKEMRQQPCVWVDDGAPLWWFGRVQDESSCLVEVIYSPQQEEEDVRITHSRVMSFSLCLSHESVGFQRDLTGKIGLKNVSRYQCFISVDIHNYWFFFTHLK